MSAASCYNKKYYFNPLLDKLPNKIKEDIKEISICIAEKIHGILAIGFYEDGSVYFEASKEENDFDYDDIGAKLEINRIEREEKELINSLSLWYKLFILKK